MPAKSRPIGSATGGSIFSFSHLPIWLAIVVALGSLMIPALMRIREMQAADLRAYMSVCLERHSQPICDDMHQLNYPAYH